MSRKNTYSMRGLTTLRKLEFITLAKSWKNRKHGWPCRRANFWRCRKRPLANATKKHVYEIGAKGHTAGRAVSDGSLVAVCKVCCCSHPWMTASALRCSRLLLDELCPWKTPANFDHRLPPQLAPQVNQGSLLKIEQKAPPTKAEGWHGNQSQLVYASWVREPLIKNRSRPPTLPSILVSNERKKRHEGSRE